MRYGTDLSFLHFSPTKIVFGAKSLQELPSEVDGLGAKRVMVVTDGVLASKTDLVDRVKRALGKRLAGVYAEVEPDSSVAIVDRGAALARELAADLIVSIGGGSSLDTAKGIAIVHTEGGSLRDHQGFQGLSRPTTPHIAIPTTGARSPRRRSFETRMRVRSSSSATSTFIRGWRSSIPSFRSACLAYSPPAPVSMR